VSVVAPNSSRFAALQYKPGSTFLHLLDARTKLLATAIAIAGVLITPQPVGYLALLVLLACATAAARVGPALFWRAFGLLLIMVVISGVITVIIWPGPAAFHVGPLRISRPGIDVAIRGTVQFFVILYTSALMTMTTAPSALGHAWIWYLNPLRRLRVPVDDIGVMVSLGLAFLPLLQQELQRILLAQRVRGADFRRGPLEVRVRNALALLPPLLVGNLRRAEELAVAMEARGYIPGTSRTILKAGHLGRNDIVAIAATLLCAAVAIWL